MEVETNCVDHGNPRGRVSYKQRNFFLSLFYFLLCRQETGERVTEKFPEKKKKSRERKKTRKMIGGKEYKYRER